MGTSSISSRGTDQFGVDPVGQGQTQAAPKVLEALLRCGHFQAAYGIEAGRAAALKARVEIDRVLGELRHRPRRVHLED